MRPSRVHNGSGCLRRRAAMNGDERMRRRGSGRLTGPFHQATSLRCQPFILNPGRCSLPWTSCACSWKRQMEPSPEVPWACRDGPLLPLGWPPQAQGSVYGIVSSHMVCSSWYRDLQLTGITNQYGEQKHAECLVFSSKF